MDELSDILKKATASIPSDYFHIPIDGGYPIYRERVYCYELYHQLRCLWPQSSNFFLNGEMDKSAHPILRKLGTSQFKPDLLIHRPGYMSGNYAIIEVKTCKAEPLGIEKDLKTLTFFRNKVGYQRAIYLIFGYEADTAVERIHKIAQNIDALPPIELWVHQLPGQSATYKGCLPTS